MIDHCPVAFLTALPASAYAPFGLVGEMGTAQCARVTGDDHMKQRNSVREQVQSKAERRRRELNHVQELREDQLLSKAELARRAGVSALTVDRIERGEGCRLDTKRKIILALGLKVADKERVFPRKGE